MNFVYGETLLWLSRSWTNQIPNKLIENIGFLTNYDSAVYVPWGCEHQKGELKWPQTFKKFHVLTAAWLAQLGECRSAEREVLGSNPGRTNTQGL